jgi:hypothetical protein
MITNLGTSKKLKKEKTLGFWPNSCGFESQYVKDLGVVCVAHCSNLAALTLIIYYL